MAEVNKYNHSKIYKICSNLTNKIYIGSTTQSIKQRLSEHVAHYKLYNKNNNDKYMSSYEIIKLGDYYVVLIEECNFNNKQQLENREGEIMKLNINNVINNRIAGRTLKEYQNDNKAQIKEYKKQYIIDNKEILAERSIQYRQDNKEILAEKKKEYRENNREDLNEKGKEYYYNNKIKILEKSKQSIICECGIIYSYIHKSRHNKSKKHINITNNLLILNELTFFNL